MLVLTTLLLFVLFVLTWIYGSVSYQMRRQRIVASQRPTFVMQPYNPRYRCRVI